jgi:hypothetical protein
MRAIFVETITMIILGTLYATPVLIAGHAMGHCAGTALFTSGMVVFAHIVYIAIRAMYNVDGGAAAEGRLVHSPYFLAEAAYGLTIVGLFIAGGLTSSNCVGVCLLFAAGTMMACLITCMVVICLVSSFHHTSSQY